LTVHCRRCAAAFGAVFHEALECRQRGQPLVGRFIFIRNEMVERVIGRAQHEVAHAGETGGFGFAKHVG